MTIKQTPEDFVVEERLEKAYLESLGERPSAFALYEVRKRGLTTNEMLEAFARNVGARVRDLAAAGLKDKLATTTQHITLRTEALHRPVPEAVESGAFAARRIGFAKAPITAAAIHSNRFQITVRGLTRRAFAELQEAAQRLMIDASEVAPAGTRLRVVNYFGNQRFGSARAGQGFIAPHLIRGEFEQALRLAIAVPHRKDLHRVKQFKQIVAERWGQWSAMLNRLPHVPERAAIEHLARRPDDFRGAFAALPYFFQQMTVEAYQSLLWNRIATTLLIERLGESGRLWVADDRFGDLVFPEAQATPHDLIDLDLPMLGRRAELREPWRAAAEKVLEDEGLVGMKLRIPGMDKPWFAEVPRSLFVIADRFVIGPAEPDDSDAARPQEARCKTVVRFALPRGAYATVVLRALGQ